MNKTYKVGTKLICTDGKSPGYKKGKEYTVVKENNMLGLVADDGFFDPLSMLVSTFKEESIVSKAIRSIKSGKLDS